MASGENKQLPLTGSTRRMADWLLGWTPSPRCFRPLRNAVDWNFPLCVVVTLHEPLSDQSTSRFRPSGGGKHHGSSQHKMEWNRCSQPVIHKPLRSAALLSFLPTPRNDAPRMMPPKFPSVSKSSKINPVRKPAASPLWPELPKIAILCKYPRKTMIQINHPENMRT